jgi:hypothetical protein
MREPDPCFKSFNRHTLQLIATDLLKETNSLRLRELDHERQIAELWRRLEAMRKVALLMIELHDRGEMNRLLDGDMGRFLRITLALPFR